MGKFLKTEYVDQVEFYLVANNLTVKDYKEAPYKYPFWNRKEIDLYGHEKGLRKDFLGGWIGFESQDYQQWLFVKYGHKFKDWNA